jgi:hypothetical protein
VWLQDEGLRFLCSKAEIIDELETTLPDWVRSPSWHPPFVHILKFHPDSTYEVRMRHPCLFWLLSQPVGRMFQTTVFALQQLGLACVVPAAGAMPPW